MKLGAMVAVSSFALSQVAAGQAVQWKVSEGGNGHWYEVGSRVDGRGWEGWVAYAESRGGHLVTLTSAAERDFVSSPQVFGSEAPSCIGGHALIGLFQPSGSSEPASGWQWVTGEPYAFDQGWWGSLEDCCEGDPYCSGQGEDAAAIWSWAGDCVGGASLAGKLNDVGKCLDWWGAIVEWSADCNNDGIVDYGQILQGQLADANSNGIPDSCECIGGPILVPADFTTIQDAIDAAADGCVIRVAPGTYAPFDVGDKRLVVESTDGPLVTTVDAAGQATSAVRFGPNSTFESVLRGFTILTGSGTVVPPNNQMSGWRAGGGVYLLSSLTAAAGVTIDSCHFVGSSGGCGYGSGIYVWEANLSVRRCRFVNLSSEHMGPAICVMPNAVAPVPGTPALHALMEDLFISGCSSYNGGGIAAFSNPLVQAPTNFRISRSELVGNSGWVDGGIAWGQIHTLFAGGGGEMIVEKCVLRNNSASWGGTIAFMPWGDPGDHRLALRDSVITDGPLAVRKGGGTLMTLQGNSICAGISAVAGAYSDLGGNAWTCPANEDCDGDGIVDLYATTLGTVPDQNDNHVPDACECIKHVPSQYPAIQTAIDSVAAGESCTVQVAAGTYHESFSLNGKNVRVQGAANNATILDGTGLTTSIARFTGGEPVTAGLANLVFRNGTAGSRIYPKATFTVGGAVYGINSSASIANCRFEQNRADYGGAVYMLYSSMNMSDCDFAGNIAENEGGGVLVYETSGSLAGCDFTQNACGVSGPGSGSGFKSVGARVAGETVLLSGCTFTGGIAGVDGSAVEHFENTANVRGKLRMVGCTVTGNASNLDAAGLRMTGAQASCVLTGGTTICSNTPRNVDGPFLIEGTATVCGCLADVTGDGQVNGGDLGVVLNSWGGADALGSGDVNHDGVIDGSDLSIVLSSWGACGG